VGETALTNWIQALASVLTLLAALGAAVIAWRVPRLAAKFAEENRRQNSANDELQRMQFQTFLQLMAHRAEHADPLAGQASMLWMVYSAVDPNWSGDGLAALRRSTV
jgi:hypothetical protein